MKARLKKQQDNDVARLSSAAMQTKLLPDVRSMDSPFSKPETAQSISQEEQGRDQGFNFAEVPIFAAGSGVAASPLQRKYTVSLARGQQEGQAPGLQKVMAATVGRQQPVQRSVEEQEEPMQGKLEPVQREEGEEEEPMQGKLEPVQREEGEEEEPMQGKLEPVQREEGEEEEPMQGKLEPVQREEGEDEEPMQGKGESDQKVKAIQPKINLAPSGGGKSMPEPVQQKMEGAFGADFSGVRIHEGPQAKSINAIAYTQGSNIHFQPGKYQPDTQSGQELLGHELTHVVQQKAGRVASPQKKGIPINNDSNLEIEADILGARAAKGEQVQVGGVNFLKGKSRDVQAKTQVSTTKNNISFKQGNILQRDTIQCKMGNLDELSEGKSGIVSKSSWWKLSTGSENIQKNIKAYNAIENNDKNYSNQRKILTEIFSLSENWLKTHPNADQNRREAIGQVARNADVELSQVEKQEKQGDGKNNYQQRSDSVGGDSVHVVSSARAGLHTVVSEQTLNETFGKGGSKALGGDGQSLVSQTTSLFQGLEASANTNSSLLDENNLGTKSLVDNYRSISGLTTKSADGTIGPKIMGLGETLGSWSVIGSVIGVIKSLYDAYSAWGEWQAFAGAQKEIKENEKQGEVIAASLKDAIEHGYGKIKRRFWGVITTVVTKVIDIVSYILTATGFGAAVGAIVKLSTTLLNAIDVLAHKIKGIMKFVKMKRGKHRAQSADTIVQNALNGDKMSLQILVNIDPLGAINRAKMGAKTTLDIAREDGLGGARKAVSAGAGALIGVFSDVFKAKTPEEMYKLLRGIKGQPEKYNININEFTAAVSEKLKSQS